MAKRVLYVLYIEQQPFADCLNAIRMLAEKVPRAAAHITVCGPFEDELPPDHLEDLNRRIRGKCVVIGGVNMFSSEYQNTLYLEVQGDFLQEVGKRTYYADYIPHVTVYNNDKRKWAYKVRSALEVFPFSCRVTVGSLQPLITGNGYGNGYTNGNGHENGNGKGNGYRRVITDFSRQMMKKATRHEFSPEDIQNFNPETRLARIRKIAQYLQTRI